MSGLQDAEGVVAGGAPSPMPATAAPGGADLIGGGTLDLDSFDSMVRVGLDVTGVQDGAAYTLSLRASDIMAEGDSFRIFWNGAPVAAPDGGEWFHPPAAEYETYSLRVTGGSGNGSNRLEVEGRGGEGGLTIAIEDVRLTGPQADDDAAAAEDGGAVHDIFIAIEGGATAQDHSLGAYLVTPETGALGEPVILFESTLASFHGGPVEPGSSVTLAVPEGAQVGLFLIRGGGQVNDYDAFGPGALAFVTPEGASASLADPEVDLVHLAPDGTATPVSGTVQHAVQTAGADGGFRPLAMNEDGTMLFGFASGPAGQGEAIYQDLWISVYTAGSGAKVLGAGGVTYGAPADAETILPDEDAHSLDGTDDDAPNADDTAGLLVLVPEGRVVLTPEAAPDAFPQEGDAISTDAPDIGSAETPDDTLDEAPADAPHEASAAASSSAFVAAPGDFETTAARAVIVPCFTPGTLIDTAEGRVPVETLRVGDRVLTRDNGFQPLEWVGRKDVSRAEMIEKPNFRGVRVAAGALGPGLPERDMVVSPQHRVLLIGPEAELMFGVHEVLAPAIHMVGIPGVTADDAPEISYIHIMCRRHEIVRSDGLWSESFQPGDLSLAGLDRDQRAELLALFPDLATRAGRQEFSSARRSLQRYETLALMAPRRPARPGQSRQA